MATCLSSRNTKSLKSVSALFLQTCFVLGTIKSVGVYLPVLELTLGLTSTDTGLALGLFDAFAFGPGPLVAYLYNRLSGSFRRCMVLIGSMLAPGGLLTASLVTNGVELALCLSVAGLGSNILSISLVIALSDQSGDAFGIFYGIGKSGYAFGMALVPLLADYLMGIYGWRGSLIIIGGVMAHLIPLVLMADFNGVNTPKLGVGSHYPGDQVTADPFDTNHKETIFNELHEAPMGSICSSVTPTNDEIDNIQLEEINEETRENVFLILESSTDKTNMTVCNTSGKRYLTTGHVKCSELYSAGCRIFSNSIYNQDRWMILLMFVTLVFAMLNGGWHAFLIPRAVAMGIPAFNALYLAYSAAVAAFIGRCFGGLLLKFKHFPWQSWFIILTFLNIASLLVDIFVPRFWLMIVTSFITSLTIAERNILVLVICKDRAPKSQFPVILASSEIVFGVGNFLGAFFSGYVADVTGTFNASFMFITAVDVLVFCLMVPPIIAHHSRDSSII